MGQLDCVEADDPSRLESITAMLTLIADATEMGSARRLSAGRCREVGALAATVEDGRRWSKMVSTSTGPPSGRAGAHRTVGRRAGGAQSARHRPEFAHARHHLAPGAASGEPAVDDQRVAVHERARLRGEE